MVRWFSKQKYTVKGMTGVILTDDGNKFFLKSAMGRLYAIPAETGKNIRAAEEARAARGRPRGFAEGKMKTVGITLPEHLWRKVKKPYSAAIAELLTLRGDNK